MSKKNYKDFIDKILLYNMILAIIQARMNSTRMPGKVLLPILNEPVINHIYKRLQFSTKIDEICISTSTEKSDDKIIEFAEKIFELAERHKWLVRPHVEPVSSDQYVTTAGRPPYSALDCSLIENTFDIHPEPWQKSLASTIQRIIQNENASKS